MDMIDVIRENCDKLLEIRAENMKTADISALRVGYRRIAKAYDNMKARAEKAEEKARKLENELSWIKSPERMGR